MEVPDVARESGVAPKCFGRKDITYVKANFRANKLFWQHKCKLLENDKHVDKLMLEMNGRVLFLKPKDGERWCGMLTSTNLHMVSRNGVVWEEVQYFPDNGSDRGDGPKYFGGSQQFITGDSWHREWRYIPFWGSESELGGCCSHQTSNPLLGGASWGQEFLLVSCEQCETLAYVTGGYQAEKHFWDDEVCSDKMIPPTTSMIRITMGSVVDYFKPRHADVTICQMLKSHDKHMFSSDGKTFVVPRYYEEVGNSTGLVGGSSEDWPKMHVPGDNRKYLTFWGSRGHSGGCCSSTLMETSCGDTAQIFHMCFHNAMKVDICN